MSEETRFRKGAIVLHTKKSFPVNDTKQIDKKEV